MLRPCISLAAVCSIQMPPINGINYPYRSFIKSAQQYITSNNDLVAKAYIQRLGRRTRLVHLSKIDLAGNDLPEQKGIHPSN